MIASKCGAHRVVMIFDLSIENHGTTPNDSCDLYGDRIYDRETRRTVHYSWT